MQNKINNSGLSSDDSEYYNKYYLKEHENYFRLEQAKQEVRFLVNHYGKTPYSVCDIGCGQGRHLIEFSKITSIGYGFGLDQSPVLVSKAENALSSNGHFIIENVNYLKWQPKKEIFDICYSLFSSFSYCTTHDKAQNLVTKMVYSLKRGGLICIDVDSIFRLAYFLNKKHNDKEYLNFNPATMQLASIKKYGGKPIRSLLQYFTANDLMNFFIKSNVDKKSIIFKGGFNDSQFTLKSERLIIMGKKK